MPKKKSKPVKLGEGHKKVAGPSNAPIVGGKQSNLKHQGSSTQKKKKSLKPGFNAPAGLSDLLDDCEYYLPVQVEEKSLPENVFLLGILGLTLADPIQEEILQRCSELWLYFSEIPGRCFVYAEWLEDQKDCPVKEAAVYRIDESSDLSFLAGNHPGKIVKLSLVPITDETNITIKVFIYEPMLIPPEDTSRGDIKTNTGVQALMKHLYSVDVPRMQFCKDMKKSIEHISFLYSNVKSFHDANWDATTLVDVQNSQLRVDLRPYQINSVNWMLQREHLEQAAPVDLHPLYTEINLPNGDTVFYNKYLGNFTKLKPLVKPPPTGGILADEMGLGKTVEVLACVMANQRYKDNDETLVCIDESDNIKIELQDLNEESTSDPIFAMESEKKVAPEKVARKRRTSMEKYEAKKRRHSKHSEEIEAEEPDDFSLPRKKVQISGDLGVIPEKIEAEREIEIPDKSPLKSAIKPFEKPKNLPLDDRELRVLTQKQKKKALQEAYLKELSQFSAVKHLKRTDPNRHAGFIEGKIQRRVMFECICGKVGDTDVTEDDNSKVKCQDCGIVQHRECVRFDRKTMGDYICPHCTVHKPLVESKSTLIVAPAAISAQWLEEVHKLVKKQGLQVKLYEGVYIERYHQPKTLAKFDVVITTYEVLTKEFDYVDLPHCNAVDGRKFRNAKRYSSIPSPLTCIQWWRICLDEAQMVDCTTTRTAKMALRLNTVHRWCITGTPINHSLQDLFGLLVFLGADPHCVDTWWEILVQGPFNIGNPVPLCDLVCPLMWRTAKADVEDQIQIPPQNELVHWINFSAIEEHFYRQQHVDCGREVLERIARLPSLDAKLQSLSGEDLNKIVGPLTNLRKACCHPQAVKGKHQSKDKDKTITMQQLLTNLIQKAKSECEESLRMIISSLNGIAGLSILQERWPQAVSHYREVLQSVEENKEFIKADKLQKIHCLRNLDELLNSNHEGIQRKQEEQDLVKEAEQLERQYLTKFTATIESAKQSLDPLSVKVDELNSQLFMEESWWSAVIRWGEKIGDKIEIIERVKQAIERNHKKNTTVAKVKNKYKDLIKIEFALLTDTEAMEKLRGELLKEMGKLQSIESQILVNQAVDCHLRTILSEDSKKLPKKCKLCEVSDTFKEYERILFREVTTRENYDHLELEDVKIFGQLQTIVWTAGNTEQVLKVLLTYAKWKDANDDWLKDGATQLKVFDAKRKEFKFLRALWSQINDYISAVDELNMCKMRFRLRYENEPVVKNKTKKQAGVNLGSNIQNKVERIYIIEAHEVEPQCLKLTLERSEGERSLRRKKGQMQYLLNLEKNDITSANAENPETCPICKAILGREWTVLRCGHCYCKACLAEVKRHSHNKRLINCPMCRENTAQGEISYINTMSEVLQEENKEKVEEPVLPLPDNLVELEKLVEAKKLKRHSAKAEVIVQKLKEILKEHPEDKVLIFSAWSEMLDILHRALTENGILCAQTKSGKKFQDAIQLFKDPLKNVTALLLPITRGSKGLNLTEARHVFLVEPILNPASELQALSRVHRIGQEKHTMVHRFVVKGTIEERMHVVLKAHQGHTKVEEDPVTLRDLYNMFAAQDEPSQSTVDDEAVPIEVQV